MIYTFFVRDFVWSSKLFSNYLSSKFLCVHWPLPLFHLYALCRLSNFFNFSFLVNKPTGSSEEKGNVPPEKSATAFNMVEYISFGVAFILSVLLSIVIGFWCRRRSHHERMKRFVSLVIVTSACFM